MVDVSTGTAGPRARPCLELRNISKTFPGQRALDDVSLTLYPGKVYGLIGHNGSGKSTLVKILAGYHQPDPGAQIITSPQADDPSVEVDETGLHHGLAFVHQDLALCDPMSILENLYEGRYRTTRWGTVDWAWHRNDATEWFRRLGLPFALDWPLARLSVPERAMVAVARAARQVLVNPGGGVLVLDEPTPYLSADGVARLFEVVRRAAASGAAVLFVGHDLEEVLEHTDEVYVLRGGQLVGHHDAAVTTPATLIAEILGDTELADQRHEALNSDTVCFELENATGGGLDQMSLAVREGEIVGITGQLSSGFDRVPYVAFGAASAQGSLTLLGERRDLRHVTPSWATRHGLALVPGNRALQGGMANRSATENLTMLQLDRHRSWGRRVNHRSLDATAEEAMVRGGVRPSRRQLPFALFSGGNQQKIVVEKWLMTDPKMLLLHEPTAGVDVGAKREILSGLRRVAAGGVGVLMASTDHDDLLDVCDRILITRAGRITTELQRAGLTKDLLLAACLESTEAA